MMGGSGGTVWHHLTPGVSGAPPLPGSPALGLLESEGQAESQRQGRLPCQVGLMANIAPWLQCNHYGATSYCSVSLFKSNLRF